MRIATRLRPIRHEHELYALAVLHAGVLILYNTGETCYALRHHLHVRCAVGLEWPTVFEPDMLKMLHNVTAEMRLWVEALTMTEGLSGRTVLPFRSGIVWNMK